MSAIQAADNVECAANGSLPLVGAQTAKCRRRPCPAQCHDIARHSAASGKCVCDGSGLVKTTLPQPPSVERHRHQYCRIGQAICQHCGNHPRESGSAGIFQTQNHPFGDIAIGHCGDNGVIIGPLRQAACAQQIIGDAERPRAMHAPRRRQKIKLRPACRAKTMIVFDNRRTAGTAWRQHEIEDRAEDAHTLVVEPVDHWHKHQMASAPDNVPILFDRSARMLRRQRAKKDGLFSETMSADVLERLDCVNRNFSHALLVGDQPLIADGLAARGIAFDQYDGDEDRLGGRDAAHDLILSSGTLDTVSDLPGALILMRRALAPDGLLLANFAAAPSLNEMRAAVAIADAEDGRAVARFHPQIDVRSAGDLLMRAGFALPVADLTTVDVAYSSFARLLDDLRDAAATNLMVQRYAVSRHWVATATAAFETRRGPDGRTAETLSYVTLTAWAPAPSQPQPAQRGSGITSLAEALRRRSD